MTNARAYQEERLRAEALAELDRAKTAFFSNVSHEFRTPLTLSLGPIEDALASPARALAGADLELVHRNNLRLLKLVNTLLDFSRIEAGRMDARYEPLDLARVTTELASTFRSAVERAGLELVIDAPPLGEDVYVDPEMWEKIILNLLSNALKFTLEGRISVRVRLDGEHALVEVRDTGTGIPAPDLPRIFERFHRLRGAGARTHEGTGIGLALVRELVRLHGGEIQAQSAPGVGTSFVVSLPRGRAHLADDRIGAARALGSSAGGVAAFREEALRWGPSVSAPPAAMQPCAVECILVADDNADMRAYVERLLGRSFRVVAVADGSAALRAALAEPPDLVLSDVMMPGLDGFALLRALRADARTRTVPVVLLSARAGEEAVLEGLDAGADDYLVKPFSARELLARVRVNVVMARERKARAAAEEASRLKDEFLATISHELRTPLTTVLAWAAILSRAPRDAATMARGLALIARNARTQAAIVEDLLDISHLVAGRLHLERRATDLRVLLSEALDAAAAPAAGKRITLIRPDADASFPLVADPARLRQAIDAVLANAIKFTPPGGLVRASVERTAGVVFVRVSDTGEGIAPTRMAHIFDRFHQGDGSAKRPHGGLGLGLAIARALVSLHGGAVSAESEGAGRGATFTLSLPTADAPLDASLTQRR
jgi:signal transduction histidine kinase